MTESLAEKAADAAVANAKPMTGNAYKVQIARTAVKRHPAGRRAHETNTFIPHER